MSFFDETSEKLNGFRKFVYRPGALDPKTKFLIALSNCVALECEPCTIYRLREARNTFNLSKNEIEEAVSIALMNRAGVTQAKFMAAWRKFENEEKNG